MHLLTLNAAGKSLAPPRTLDPRRRRLSQVVGRHVDKSRPHMIAIQRARDPLQPIDEAWVTRGRNKAGDVKPWPRRYLPADAVVVVVYLPRGGIGGGSAGSRRKSPLSIALGIAGLALAAFAGPIAGALLPSLVFGSTATFALQAGLVIGGTALLSLASRAKANKTPTDTTQIYGVSGGGNLPKPGDRIPRGYGRSWMKPDLSQPDFSQYDGDDQILLKRHTNGLGKYHIYQVRAGKQVMWKEGSGFLPPFDDARNAIEFLYGTPSTLVPSNVISAAGVGGQLPRPEDNPTIAGPFLINQTGALINRLQVDFQFPQGISSTITTKSKVVLSNQVGAWSVLFEYAPIDAGGTITGPWQTLYSGSDATEGFRFATHPLRYTKFLDVPAGRYAVRGRNRLADTTASTGAGAANINAAQWDGASGWVNDVAIRPGVTEMALRMYATKGNQASAFGEIEIDAAAIIPVWTGSQWVEQETSKAVWAFLDIMRNQDYGGAISDNQLDLGTALYYAGALSEFDTFDATIRGPVSVYEAAASVLLAMRAEPVHLGRFWSLVRDEPKSVRRHVITRRQMLKGSSQITFDLDTESGAGHVIGEFDQDGDYRVPNQTLAIYGEASLTPTRQRWTGVKSYAHAQHLTRWRASSGAFRRQAAPFGVEMEGRIYKRGDSISVDPWFIDVRKAAGVVDNDGDTLHLDCDVVLAAGEMATLRDRAGREWGPLAVSQGASARDIVLGASDRQSIEAQTGLTLAKVLSDGRRDMTTIVVGALVDLQENYLIQSAKMDGAYKANIEALIDDPRVWAAIGAATGNPPPGYGGILESESPSILSLTANIVPIAAGFRLTYAIQPGRGARSFEVGLSYDNGSHFDARSDADMTGSIELNPVDPTTLVLRARAFGATGLPGVFVYTPVDLPASALNVALAPIAYDDLDDIVQGQLDKITPVVEGLDNLRKALALDPSVRQGYVDTIIGDLRGDLELLLTSADRNQQALADLQGSLASAGLEVIPAEGRARFYAIEALQSEVGTQVTSLSVNVDALKHQVELYGSVQTGDLSGLISQITTVSQTLNALQGTISSLVTSAQFNPLISRLGSAETRLDAQAASIASKAEQATVSAQGLQISQVQQSLNAALGTISQAVQSTNSASLDQALLPKTLTGFLGLLGEQLGALSQSFARAESNLSAGFDDAGRATAQVQTKLFSFQDQAAAQFVSVTKAVADATQALVQTQALYDAQFASTTATISQLTQTVATGESALAQRLDAYLVRLGSAEGSVASETQARISADGVLTSNYDALLSRVGGVEAGVSNEAQARASGDAANASSITTLFAQSSAGTAAGRFGMSAVSAPSGVSVRLAAVASTETYGVQRNAGWYLDLMPDGTSRFVVDANLFALTANGGLTYPFTFDGTTLTVPSLRVTQSAILPGAVSTFDSIALAIGTVDSGQTSTTRFGTAQSVSLSVDANAGLLVGVDALTRVTANSITNQNRLTSATFSLYLFLNGNNITGGAPFIVNGVNGFTNPTTQDREGTVTVFRKLPPGTHKLELVYAWQGQFSNDVAQIIGGQLDYQLTKR
ncbi:hypothetical protein HCU64_06465 [Methylobacterium sp. C25]|uniref:host specificity factor TipJ family phage tail protein n=1 Tax=Methylobacterium sp. C25 TaxID=2721622 RepID=UPI001F2D64DF|nr:host specificity factor TipJ family phage tail protein [Methylobacterium sp. C25]MCE4223389.1 hypothetical protein [Methylobacterium sp. C25]